MEWGARRADGPLVGIEQATTRVREIQAMVSTVGAGARPGGTAPVATDPAFAAQLQGQLGAGAAADPATGLPATLDPQLLARLSGGSSALGIQSMLTGAAPPTAGAATPSRLTGDVAGLDPQLLASLEQVAAQLGSPIEVKSGLRTTAEQQELYRRYLNGTGNLAAKPGTSNHETGRAVDAYVGGVALASVDGSRAAAAAAGLGFPVGGEPWHVERAR